MLVPVLLLVVVLFEVLVSTDNSGSGWWVGAGYWQ